MTDYFSYLLLEIIVFVCFFNNIIAIISFDFIQLKLKFMMANSKCLSEVYVTVRK